MRVLGHALGFQLSVGMSETLVRPQTESLGEELGCVLQASLCQTGWEFGQGERRS